LQQLATEDIVASSQDPLSIPRDKRIHLLFSEKAQSERLLEHEVAGEFSRAVFSGGREFARDGRPVILSETRSSTRRFGNGEIRAGFESKALPTAHGLSNQKTLAKAALEASLLASNPTAGRSLRSHSIR
jgi:hypothetical protein